MVGTPETKSRTRAAPSIPISLFTVNIGWSSGKRTQDLGHSVCPDAHRHPIVMTRGTTDTVLIAVGVARFRHGHWSPPHPGFHHRNSQKLYRHLTVDSILIPVLLLSIPEDLRLLSHCQ